MATSVEDEPWKKLLKELSRHITKKNVDELLFYTKEFVPEGERETVTNSFEFLTYMDRAGIIFPNNVEILRKMLDYIGRKDLITKLIKPYEEQITSTNELMPKGQPLKSTRSFDGASSVFSVRETTEKSQRPLSQDFSGTSSGGDIGKHKKVSKSKSSPSLEPQPSLLPPDYFLKQPCNKQPQESQENTFQQDDVDSRSQANNNNVNNNNGRRAPYEMTNIPSGKCIIINNMFNTEPIARLADGRELPPRKGSEKDVITLRKIFSWLHFEVEVFENVKLAYMEMILEEISSSQCHEKYDAFVCFILSHGFEKGVYTSDGAEFLLSDIKNYFKGDRAIHLHGKPKLFFIQACQGEENNTGRMVETDSPLDRSDTLPSLRRNIVPNTTLRSSISADADMIFCMATTPGNVSYRDTCIGSWFIQELCEILKESAEELPLNELLLELNDRIAKKEAQTPDGVAKMMSDCGQNTMRKSFLFRPSQSYYDFAVQSSAH